MVKGKQHVPEIHLSNTGDKRLISMLQRWDKQSDRKT